MTGLSSARLAASQTGFAVMATARRYNSTIRTRDLRSEEDPDKHNQGGHDSRRNREEDPGGRVVSQESRYGYQPQTSLSENRRDADSKLPGSYTDPATSYTGRRTMLLLNAQVPVYHAPNPDQLIRPKDRGEQEDSPSHLYERRQPNQEDPNDGPSASMHEQVTRHEALPFSGSRHSRTESTTKKTTRSSRQSTRRRGPSRNVDDDTSDDNDKDEEEEDEKIDDKRVPIFIPSSGIDIEVLVFYLKRYLGHDTDAHAGMHPPVSIFATTSNSH